MAVLDILARLRIDKGDSDSVFGQLAAQTEQLRKNADIPVTVDTEKAAAGFEELNAQTSVQVRSINEWKTKLAELRAERDKAEDTASIERLNQQIAIGEAEVKKLKTATIEGFDKKPVDDFNKEVDSIGSHLQSEEGKLGQFKEKAKESFGEGLKGVAEFATGGLIANGISGIFSEIVTKAREADNASDSLSVALTRTGLSGAAAKEEIARLGESAEKIANDFALPQTEVTALQAKIAGFGGVSGQQLDRLTELSIGAANALQMPADAVAKMIAKSADPEQAAALSKLGIQFDKNATVAEKMAVIEAKLGPSIQATKDSTNDAIGNFDRLKNTTEEAALAFGSSAFEAVGPVFTALIPVVGAVGDGLSTFGKITAATIGFIGEHKAEFALLAIGIGAIAISANAAAIGTGALTIAQKAQAISTGVVTGAQTLLNTVMSANPIGLVIAGIAALSAGAIYLYNNVKPVHDAIDSVWTVLKGTGAFIATFVKSYIGGLVDAFSGVGKVISGIVHLDFDEVKAGAAQVGKGVSDAYGGSAAKGVAAFSASVDESKTKLQEQGEAARKAGDDAVDAAERSAAAQEDAQKRIAQANADFQARLGGAQNSLSKDEENYIRQEIALRQGYNVVAGQKVALSEADRAAYIASNKALVEAAAQHKEILELNKETTAEADKIFKIQDKQKKAAQDLFALAKQRADDAAKEYEVGLRIQRDLEHRAFTSADELSVQQKLREVFGQQVEDLDLMNAQKAKFAGKTSLEIKVQQDKELTLKAKVDADTKKLQQDIQTALDANFKKEIELGIRPKSDTLQLITEETARIQQELDKAKLKLSDPATADEAKLQVAQLQGQLYDLEKQRADFVRAQDKETADNRIALFQSQAALELDQAKQVGADKAALEQEAQQNELNALNLKLQQDLQFVRDATDQDRELNQAELLKKQQIEIEYQKNLLALKEKYAKQAAASELDVVKAAKDGILGVFKSILEERKKLNAEEYNDKLQQFDKERTGLEANLQKGDISQREYATKVAKLDSDRTKFLEENDDSFRARVKRGIDKQLEAVQSGLDQEVQATVLAETEKALQVIIGQDAQTTAVQTGSAARQVANLADKQANDANSQSSIIGAATKLIEGYIGFLGPFAGPIAGIAAALALQGAIKLVVSGAKAIGFADGGMMGVVGEQGPEVVGPAKDFSFMVGKLVVSTADAVERAIAGARSGGANGRQGQVDVRLGGRATVAGRELQFALERENFSARNERLAAA